MPIHVPFGVALEVSGFRIGAVQRQPRAVRLGQVTDQSLAGFLDRFVDRQQGPIVRQEILAGFGTNAHADVFPDLDRDGFLREVALQACNRSLGEARLLEVASQPGVVGRPIKATAVPSPSD